MHSVYVEEVGLHSPLTAELQFVDCVICVPFWLGQKNSKSPKATAAAPFTLTCQPVEQSRMDLASGGGTKTASTYYTLLRLPCNTLFTYQVTSKQA